MNVLFVGRSPHHPPTTAKTAETDAPGVAELTRRIVELSARLDEVEKALAPKKRGRPRKPE